MITSEQDIAPQRRAPAWFKILILALVMCQLGFCVAGARPSLDGKVDFRPFYASGLILRTGQQAKLYDYDYQKQVQDGKVSPRPAALPFLYPPFAALLFIPLSLLSYRQAFAVQLICNLGLLCGVAWMLRSRLPALKSRNALLLPALFACLFPMSIALMQGQLSILLLFICASAYCSLQKNKKFTAGLILCLLLIKFQLALPILLLFFLWKEWYVVKGFITGSLILAVISYLVVGIGGLASYVRSIFAVGSMVSGSAAAAKARFGMFPTDMPNIHGLTFALSRGASWGVWLNMLLCCVVLYYARRSRPSLLVALPAAMLISYHMQPHDLVLLLLPLTVAFEDYLVGRQTAPAGNPVQLRRTVWLLVPVLIMLLPIAPVLMLYGAGYLGIIAVAAVMLQPSLQTAAALPYTILRPEVLAS